VFSDRTTSALTEVVMERSTYVVQTTGAQRSIVSSSASDSSAGTGARQVQITYLDAALSSYLTETITLNGTTAVNTVATNICHIQTAEIISVGSGGVPAGTISLKTATAGGGTNILTINPGNNQYYGARLFIPVNKLAYITGISAGHNGTTVGSGALFRLLINNPTLTTGPLIQRSDFVRLYGQSSTFSRVYQSPIAITGPSLVQLYFTPETTSSTIYRGSFDYFIP
jgi:hypothetical protein